MVLLTLGILAGLALVGIALYWRNIIEWIGRVWEKLQQRIQGNIEGVRTFIVKTKEGFKNETKYYSRNKITEEWEETVILKSVDESEIPRSILQNIKGCEIGSEVETTKDLLELIA